MGACLTTVTSMPHAQARGRSGAPERGKGDRWEHDSGFRAQFTFFPVPFGAHGPGLLVNIVRESPCCYERYLYFVCFLAGVVSVCGVGPTRFCRFPAISPPSIHVYSRWETDTGLRICRQARIQSVCLSICQHLCGTEPQMAKQRHAEHRGLALPGF